MLSFFRIISGQQRGFVGLVARGAFSLLAVPYGSAVALRNWAFRRGIRKAQKAPIPVISVGNLTVGGTGKTPTVAFLCRLLRQKGLRVVVISRGYRAGDDGMNDEAKELEAQLPDVPHLQDANRFAASKRAYEEFESQVIVLDDGFQHRQLHRDLDIVLLDATNPFGFNHLLPRGLLREPLASLQRADVVMATRADQVPNQSLANIRTVVQRYAPTAAWVETAHRPVCWRSFRGESRPLDWLGKQPVVAFCGIGNGAAFFETLKQLNVQVVERIEFGDHHNYTREDIERIQKLAEKSKAKVAVCTGKDLPKIGVESLRGVDFWSLQIELEVLCGSDPLEERLQKIVSIIPRDDEA